MPDATTTAAALAPLREALQADGADLLVQHADADTVTVALVVRDAACAECILPADHLRAVIAQTLRHLYPDPTRIAVHDPREG